MLEFFEAYLPLLMFLSLILLMFSGFQVGFVLGGVALLFGLIGISMDLFSYLEFNNIVLRIWGGIAENLLLVSVPMFVFMGFLLERSGVAEALLEALQAMLGAVPGGLGIAVTLLGTILAATTGIIGASVVMLGILTLPTMLRQNYRKELAVGTICASGTLGILLPPSIMLVLMGELLSISVGELFLAAIVPGLLLAGSYMLYISIAVYVSRKKDAIVCDQKHNNNTSSLTYSFYLKSFVPPVFLIALVLGSIFLGWATPTEASGIGAFGALILAICKGRLSRQVLTDVVNQTTTTTSMIFTIFIGATAFSYVFRSLGGDEFIAGLLGGLPFAAWGILLVTLATVFILGFFFDWIEIIFIVLPLFAPVVFQLDFSDHIQSPQQMRLWFALLIAINLQTSFLTPPFGFALFYLKGVAPPEIKLMHLYRGVIPFVLIQLLILVLVLLFPQLVTWLPETAF